MHKEYLQEGPLSKFTPLVREFAQDIQGEGIDLMFNIHAKVDAVLSIRKDPWASREERDEMLLKEHQKRSAEEILKSDYTYGCDEFGILIATIARSKGIPTKYIQCADLIPFLKENALSGHVYLEFYLDSGTYLMDSTKGVIVKIYEKRNKQKLYRSGKEKQMIKVADGLDPHDAGIFSHEDLMEVLEKGSREYVEMTGYELPM